MTSSDSTLYRYAIVLGLLTTVGPVAIDMYLPALPLIARDLAAAPQTVQASLMSFYLALGAGQLIAGPLSDMWGRKRPMYVGLALFIAASVGCALASTTQALIAFRFAQGLGACACMVTPRAVVRDLHTGPAAARLMSMLLMVYTVSPILAPLAGSEMAGHFGWRGVFGALAVLAAVAAALVLLVLPETRPRASRMQGSLRAALTGYRTLLHDRRFVALAFIASGTLGAFYVYVANSAFVFGGHFGVTPRRYALLFALNAVSFVVVSQFNGWLTRRFGLARTVKAAVVCQAATTLLLFALTWAGVDRLDVTVAMLLLAFGLNAVIVPSTFVLAMERHAALAGSASAVMGTMNFAGGAVAMALVAPFANGTPLPMAAGIAACLVTALVLALTTL